MKKQSSPSSAGFSLVELLVAMTITMIVSGAVYGLLAGGQTAFKREPERTDLQQNLRVGMDVITRDVATAGTGMWPFQQVFTPDLDGDAITPAPPTGPIGKWDQLRFLAEDTGCPRVAIFQQGANLTVRNSGTVPDCFPEPGLVLIIYDPDESHDNVGTRWGWGHEIHAQDGKLNFPKGQQAEAEGESEVGGPNTLGGAVQMTKINFIRYEIAVAPDDTIPSLWRSARAGFDDDGQLTHPSEGQTAIDGGGWELIARGIEDMQIEYRSGTNTWANEPPVATTNNLDSIVREVRITLAGRSDGRTRVQGERAGPGGNALRSQLVSSVVPRAAMLALQNTPGSNPMPVWQ